MKKIKKSLSILLALLMLTGTFSLAGSAEILPMKLEIESVFAQANSDVAVDVNISNNPGVAAMKFHVEYDESILEMVSVEYNSEAGGKILVPQSSKSPFTLIWASPLENSDFNGTFATLNFKVMDNSCGKTSPITVDFDAEDIHDTNEENVEVTVINGNITVANHTGGTASCVTKATCTYCGENYGELGAHVETVIATIPATCTQSGLTQGKKCSVCNEVLVAQNPLEPLGHLFSAWNVIERATCESEGLERRECSRCHAAEEKELAKKDHSDNNGDGNCDDCGRNIKEANCKCICHNNNIFVKIIYKIVHFFWKLFKLKRSCACGVSHY